MKLPGFSSACDRVLAMSERDDSSLFHGSNKQYAETLVLIGDLILVNDFEMPVQGGGILGYIRA